MAGTEVDFVVEAHGKFIPNEVKLSATPHPATANSIRTFQRDFEGVATQGYVVHPGDIHRPLGRGVTALPFAGL